jgi:hypothetical protein
LILMFAGRGFADGAYQRTDDRKKTIVWNNDPQPGDAAEWTGSRDSEGYAEGAGTVTWLRTQKSFATGSNIAGNKKVPISRYTGTMVRGKFVGAVTTVDHGKTYHAKFVDGQRKGNWSLGPAVAKATSVESTTEPEEPKKAPEPKIVAAEKVASPAGAKITEEAEPEPPTEGPDEAKPEATSQKSAVTAPKAQAPLIAQASSEVDESATPRQQPVTKKAALAPGAVRAIEQPDKEVEKKSEKPKVSSPKIKATPKAEPPKPEATVVERELESPAEGPASAAAEKPPAPSSKITKTEKPEVSQPSTIEAPPLPKETPADDSIRNLTGPPASLRVKSAPSPETAPEAAVSTTPAAPPSAVPKLNAVQAMDIADIEARTKGYDLGEYQLPKAEYNASNDTWSVSYIGRDRDKKANHLSVIVQDKTAKAEVKR